MQKRDFTNTKVFLFNGPPSSGKDLAAIICRNFIDMKIGKGKIVPYRSSTLKFADPLKQAAHALMCLPFSCEFYEKEYGNEWKDEECQEFFGKTPRSEYIAISEEYAKVRHGPDVFGKLAARRIALEKQANVFLIPDSGFAMEAVPVISLVGVNNVVVVELTRPGTSFDGDSRSHIGAELSAKYAGKLKVIRIPNDGDKDDFRLLLHGTMMKYLGVEP